MAEISPFAVIFALYIICTVKSEGSANEQALIDSEDEIRSVEALMKEELTMAPRNTVQPSSHAALHNAKLAMAALKDMLCFSYYFGSTNRRRDLCEKVRILGSHKAYYKASRRQRVAPSSADVNNLKKLKGRPTADKGGAAGGGATALTPVDHRYLMDMDSEIQTLMQLQWYTNTEAGKKNLTKKKIEFATALDNLGEAQRLDWLSYLA